MTPLATVLCLSATAAAVSERQQQPPPQPTFGGAYAELDARRRALIDGWVARLSTISGQPIDAAALYDTRIRVSIKTTFEAVTHALMTSSLTDAAGERSGDALDLIERVDSVKGEVPGASGDRQFRMYAALKAGAVATLERSREFRRGIDNTVYHKGYPINYRETGGIPSIQISIARDGRNADIDVDYRGSSFPIALFNGHLTSANSDVRAGANYDRHVNRWTGFTNWWRGFLGIRLDRTPGNDRPNSPWLPTAPRTGKKNIDVMAQDFLQAWLVEGNVLAAMGYISDRAYACMAEDLEDPASFDRGMAPFQLMNSLKAAKDALGSHASLVGLTAGVRLTNPALKVVTQPHHAQYVLYSVPDNVAASFDCQSRLTLAPAARASRSYGRHFGTVFYVPGRGGALAGTGTSVALLWAQENGYWKIVSWQTEPEDEDLPDRPATLVAPVTRGPGDPAFVQSARSFLESWLVRHDYDAAFRSFSPRSYACYSRGSDQPAPAAPEEAGRAIRAALEGAGDTIGRVRALGEIVAPVDPVHSRIRIVDHPDARTFSLASVPDALADADLCGTPDRAAAALLDAAPQYGRAYGLAIRFRTRSGETPVLRMVWLKEGSDWKIVAYEVVMP